LGDGQVGLPPRCAFGLWLVCGGPADAASRPGRRSLRHIHFLPHQMGRRGTAAKGDPMAVPASQRRVIAALVLLATGVTAAGNGHAIGQAVLVEHEVTGSLGGQIRRLADGSGVFTNELIATRAASMARLCWRRFGKDFRQKG